MWTFQEQLSQSDEANSVKKRARKKIQEYVKSQQLKPHMQQTIKDSKGSKSPKIDLAFMRAWQEALHLQGVWRNRAVLARQEAIHMQGM